MANSEKGPTQTLNIERIQLLLMICMMMISRNLSQAQGLAGKRVVITYDAKMFNSLQEPVYRNQLKNIHHWLRFNYTHQFGVDVVLNSMLTTGVNTQFFRTNSSDNKFYIFAKGVGLHLKGFLKQNGSIAPLGNWWKLGYVQYFYQAKLITDFKQRGTYNNWELQVGFGRQTVLYKDLLLNVGLEIGGGIAQGKTELTPEINEEEFLLQVIGRINSYNTIFLHIGLAYVIF